MRIESTQAIPRPHADSAESAPRQTAQEGEISFDWGALVLQAVHPVKVAIIEALQFLQVPLSASKLQAVFKGSGYSLGVISHHVQGLVKWEALELIFFFNDTAATEKLYYFPVSDQKSG